MELYEYQRTGVAAMLAMRGDVLLADEPGLGKTAQAITYANRIGAKSVLIVCPATLCLNWRRELVLWNAGFKATVISYNKMVDASEEYDLAIFDEAHYLKNPKTKRTKAALKVRATRRLLMTGTPIVNRPIDLYPLLSMLRGFDCGTRTAFGKRFCAGHLIPIKFLHGRPVKYAWDFSGASNLDRLGSWLRGSVMVRRRKVDVLTELPAKIRQVIELDTTSGESAELRKIYNSFTNCGKANPELKRVLFDRLALERKDVALSKAAACAAHIELALEEDSKLVVFFHHHEVLASLKKALSGHCSRELHGQQTPAEKQRAVDDFQNSPEVRIIYCQIQTAGVGITLTAAKRAVFVEIDWVPGNVTQAEDRLHRIGQTLPVLIQHLVAADSVDMRIVKALVDKQRIIEAALTK